MLECMRHMSKNNTVTDDKETVCDKKNIKTVKNSENDKK